MYRRPRSEETRNKQSLALTGKIRDFDKLKSWTQIRERLFRERGRKCERCGWTETNPFTKIIPVQIDHKDGNNKNNAKENLEILCPNCHSLTEFFMFYGRKHKPKSLV